MWGGIIYQLKRKKEWKWMNRKGVNMIKGEWKDEKRDMKEQGQLCKDTHTMAHIHQVKRMVERNCS